ncbi:MAG: threonine--tRNA ligase [bacterium]|nr:threonine--tRNA ligase [bacterium]
MKGKVIMARQIYAGMDREEKENDPLYTRRHSLAHVMAAAVRRLFPDTKLGFGPAIDNGFYYDFQFAEPFDAERLPEIEAEMRRIIAEKQDFVRRELPFAEAVKFFEDAGEKLKAEYMRELVDKGETISLYDNGEFTDMCAGPHVDNTSRIPSDCFCLDYSSGAYWRGDQSREMLTRIYGLAFSNKKELKEFIKAREEAKKYDHRKLGKELELFTMSEKVGLGLPLWLPNGTVLREELEKLAKEWEQRDGYKRVVTPVITNEQLFYTSGHLPYYADSMYPPMSIDEGQNYYLKPMNCPFHHVIFGSRPRSYRELPLRLAEYGNVYRYEASGTLAGLLRVRGMCMNDAHIYCSPEQLENEFRSVIMLHKRYYELFRIENYWLRLSLHDEINTKKYVNNPEAWKQSEDAIRRVMKDIGIACEEVAGEAAFYGPKVDFQIRNVVGREETASTNQLDFAVPERFNLTYTGSDGEVHTPYCIHRAPLGTHERFLAFLMERFKGVFPTWMAPLQVLVVPVSVEKFGAYAEKLAAELNDRLFRAEADLGPDSMNKKIRNAATAKIPNILVVGGKEEETMSVTWRRHGHQEQRSLSFAAFTVILEKMRSQRVMDNFADVELPEA